MSKEEKTNELSDEELEAASGGSGMWFEVQTPFGKVIYGSDSSTPLSAVPEKPSRCPMCGKYDIEIAQVTDSRLVPKGFPTKAYHYVCKFCGHVFE